MVRARSFAKIYGTPVAAIAIVTLLKLLSGDVLGRDAPFALMGLAILATGWIAGARGALLASLLATVVCWQFFIPPYALFKIEGPETAITVMTVLAEGVAISAIIGRMQSARAAAETAALRVTRLQALATALAGARTPEDVASAVVRHGVDALEARTGVFVRPQGNGQLELVAHRGVPREVAQAFATFPVNAANPSSVAFRTGRPEWVEDAADYQRRYPGLPQQVGTGTGGAVALPLVAENVVLAVAAFRFDEGRRFDADERLLMQTFATQAGQALHRAELYSHEVLARRRLEALENLSEALSRALTRSEVVQVVLDRGMKASGADICTLYALNERDGSLELIGDRGVSPTILDSIRTITSESGNPTFRTITTGEAQWAESEADYAAIYPELANRPAEGPRARSFWSVPLIAERKPIGLLGMGFYASRSFSSEERSFVETFTGNCAEALRRAERLETERSARAAAERLQSSLATTLRSIGDAVIATDLDGNVVLMNPVAEQLTGWKESEAMARPLSSVFRIIHRETRQELESPVQRVLRGGTVIGLADDTMLVSRDGGREIPIEDSGAPIRRDNDVVEGVVLVFRDVSDKSREQARRAFLARATTALFESLDYQITLARVARLAVPTLADWCSVHVVEDDQTAPRQLAVAHVDPAKIEFARQLGAKYPPDPNAKSGVPNVLRSGRAELYPEIPEEMIRAGAVDEEHLRLLKELRLGSAMVVPLTARGRVLGAMTFIYAESNRHYSREDLQFGEELARRCAIAIDNARLYAGEKRARGEADLASRAKDELLATVSHELRTPLTAIIGWAKLLASPSADQARRTRALETIERNAVAMAQLIDDLLDMSRVVRGRMRLEMEPVSLVAIIEAAVESIKPAADAKQVQLVPMFDLAVGPLSGDPARLQQVVWNLLSNAVKFTAPGGRVQIVLRQAESAAEICITDTGKGIDPKLLPYVFDAFWQEEGNSTRSRGGLGLGLAITRQLVQLHGGQITVDSEGPGKGASFVVRLPLAPAADVAAQLAGGTARAVDDRDDRSLLSAIRVLVVDDHADTRDLVRTVLEECGSRVAAASDVDEALAMFAREIPDVLISDIGLPGQDGVDLIRRIRALPAAEGGNVPAAALTAYGRAEDRRRVLDAGYSMHIPKPLEPAELIAVVADLTRFMTRHIA